MEKFTNGRQAMGKFMSLYGRKTLRQLKRYDELVRRFKKKYSVPYCYLASSSGRVEIVGNHTDHNGGKVVGCAVDLDIVAAFLPNDNGTVTVSGNNYRDIVFDVSEVEKVEGGSVGMVKGVLAGIQKRGGKIGGFDALLSTTVPGGSGISSSAAFQLLIASIQNALYNDGELSPQTMAEVGQYAENVYFNKPCGLLDQGVVAVGGIVTIDFHNGFKVEKLGGDFAGLNLVVVNTGKSHAALTEHYAAIPKEMKDVAVNFGKEYLIDVDEQVFYNNYRSVCSNVGERAALRAKHFFEENHRVDDVCTALKNRDKKALITTINASGESSIHQLQNCSVGDDRTIADAVEFAKKVCPQCAARVHGGGFQGTILAVLENRDVRKFSEEMGKRYGKNNVFVLHARSVGATVL